MSINKQINVTLHLPDEAVEVTGLLAPYREARIGYQKAWYHCPKCEGWIEGHPEENDVATLSGQTLSGRHGTAYCCCRCDTELGFNGCVS